MKSTNPAIVTQSAARRLPRIALVLFCLAYVLPGFLGREPWKNADAAAFGAMLEMAAGHGSWWQPQIMGIPAEQAGLLPYWLGAGFIKLLPFLTPDLAARLPFALLLTLTLVCTWQAVYQLAHHQSAHPLSFAFGGEAPLADYARALADGALLALVACLGLAQLSHETTPDVVRLCSAAAMLYGAAALARPHLPAWVCPLAAWTLASAALVLSGAAWTALALGLGFLSLIWLPSIRRPTRQIDPHALAPSITDAHRLAFAPAHKLWATALFALVMLGAAWTALLPGAPCIDCIPRVDWQAWARLLLWFTWPAWPLVIWALWRWRYRLHRLHLSLALWSVIVGMAGSLLSPQADRYLLLSLPAFAALASFALPTLGRSVSALIDWFTLLFFTACGLIIWVIWFAMMTGVPSKPAANVAKLAPGYAPEFSGLLLGIALLATGAWLWLVAWRVGRHREAIWKSLVLPAGGSTLCWLLLMTLWLPLLNFARSYGPMARHIATLVPAHTCLAVEGLSQAQISALKYHGQLQLQRLGSGSQSTCPILLISPQRTHAIDPKRWVYQTTVWRLSDKKETFFVYQYEGIAPQ